MGWCGMVWDDVGWCGVVSIVSVTAGDSSER